MKLTIFNITFATLLLVGCGNYQETKFTPPAIEVPTKTGDEAETSLDFATIKREVLKANCIDCHTGRHAAYESYAVVKASLPAILARVKSTNPALRMPKDAPALSADKIAQLEEWIQAGAPEFAKTDMDQGDNGNGGDDSDPVVEGVDFAMIKAKILTPKCVACHSHFNDYEPVKRVSGSILSLVLSDKMPFPKKKGEEVEPLSKEDKDLLMEWVGAGAPEKVGDADLPLPEPEIKPNWISLRNNIFGPKCIQCHNSFGPRAPTAMETHKKLREWFAKSPALFNFESPNDSHFIGALIARVDDDEFFFDVMPLNSSFDDVPTNLAPVPEEQIKIIEKWIELKLPFDEEDL